MRRKFYSTLRGDAKSLTIVGENAKIVPLQSAGDQPPFFMVDSYPYFIDVVSLLKADRPILSLIGQEETQTSDTYDISSEATAHVKTILDYQPHGPYMMGGCSASGIVAYEIAQQLLALGHNVGLLVLFDTPNPYFMREFSAVRLKLASYGADLSTMRWREMPGWAAGEFRGLVQRKIAKFRRVCLGTSGLEADQFGPLTARMTAARKYRPKPYKGSFLLIKRYRELTGRYRDPKFGWGEVVNGDIEVCTVSALDHLEIFKSETDRALVAQKLRACFNRIEWPSGDAFGAPESASDRSELKQALQS